MLIASVSPNPEPPHLPPDIHGPHTQPDTHTRREGAREGGREGGGRGMGRGEDAHVLWDADRAEHDASLPATWTDS